MRTWILVLVLPAVIRLPALGAEEKEAAPENPAHDELRTLRAGLFDAYEKRDIEQMLEYVHQDAVITWQNGDVNRGRQGLREFYKKMMEGDDRVVECVTSKLTVDDLSIIHGGDTAVAFGTIDDEYRLSDGTDFNLTSRWTATVVKEGDRWVVASFHVSANVFDNPILDMAKSYLIYVGIIAGLVGLLLGVVAVKLVAKLRKPSA